MEGSDHLRNQVALDSTSDRTQRQGEHTSGDHASAQTLVNAPASARQLDTIIQSSASNHIWQNESNQYWISASTRRCQEHRLARDVNGVENCAICKESLGVATNVARCYYCAKDSTKFARSNVRTGS